MRFLYPPSFYREEIQRSSKKIGASQGLQQSIARTSKEKNFSQVMLTPLQQSYTQATGSCLRKLYNSSLQLQERHTKKQLSASVVKKMILRFLLEKNMPPASLAKVLTITLKELNRFLATDIISERVIAKMNLPIIKLYCKTQWKKNGGFVV